MILAIAKIFAALGLMYYAMARLNAALKKFPMDRLLDMLTVVAKKPIRSILFGLGSSILICSGLPHYLIASSLINRRSITIYNAYLVILWTYVGFLILFYLTMIPVKAIILLILGLLCFILTGNRFKEYMGILETAFGLCFFIFAFILLSQGFFYFASSAWFKEILIETKISHVLIYFVAMFLWFGFKSIWINLLVGAGAMEMQYKLTQVLVFLSGTTTAIALYGLYTLPLKKGGFKQFSLLSVIFYSVCALLEMIWCWIALISNDPKVTEWILVFGKSSRLICINFHMTCLILSAIILSLARPFVVKKIEQYCPLEEIDDPGQLKYLDIQAVGSPEIALDMVLNEQRRYVNTLSNYMELIRKRPDNMLQQFEYIHDSFKSLYQQVDLFISDLLDRQVSDHLVDRFINVSLRQKNFKALEADVSQFTLLGLSFHENEHRRDIMERMLESLDVTILNLRDALEQENSNMKTDDTLLQLLIGDRSTHIETIRKTFLEEHREFTETEKKEVLEATLFFERALWFIEQITKQVFEQRHTFAEHQRTKQRWLRQLSAE